MSRILLVVIAALLGIGLYFLINQTPSVEHDDQLLALVDYRSLDGRDDGLVIVDVTPGSSQFGQILQNVPIGNGVLPHHPYFNRDRTKLYNTALGGEFLYRIDLADNRIKKVVPLETTNCIVGEDLYFSQDQSKFYLTCMGSDRVVVFDAQTEKPVDEFRAARPEAFDQNNSTKMPLYDPVSQALLGEIDAPTIPFVRYPHGIAVNELIDRMIVTETIKPDLSEPGTHVTVIRASTGDLLQTIPLIQRPGKPSAPVEVLFHPTRTVAYVTGMMDASIWALVWNSQDGNFIPRLVDSGESRGESWPLEPIFGPDGHLYVSWALPGVVNVYSIENLIEPKLIRTLPADAGAHHIDFSPDGKYMFVQNNLLNLDGLNAGTITVVDLDTGEKVGTITSLLDKDMLPESLVILGANGH